MSWVSCKKNLAIHSVISAVNFLNWVKTLEVTPLWIILCWGDLGKFRDNNSDRGSTNISVNPKGCKQRLRRWIAILTHRFYCFLTVCCSVEPMGKREKELIHCCNKRPLVHFPPAQSLEIITQNLY